MNKAIERLAEAVKKAGWSLQCLALSQNTQGDDCLARADSLIDNAEEDAMAAMAAMEEAIYYIKTLRAQIPTAQAS